MDFNEYNLKSLMHGKEIGDPLFFFPETESTNALAFNLAENGAPEGTVVIADTQSKGRGRLRNREWLSPPGLNLYTSIILRPPLDATQSSPITLMAGVAVAESLSYYCPKNVSLKWPNDVLIDGKKACGILTEIKTECKKVVFIILGIGININMKKDDMPLPLKGNATSLLEETGSSVSRLEVAAMLYGLVGKFYQLFIDKGFAPIRDLWHHYSAISDRRIEVAFGNELLEGKAAGLDETGALILIENNGKTRRVIAGDVYVK
jgi:BirA family transcriptional regulator, biotin operon repressor / biotin---[acetyl-CoA-carboxylase] ligase